MNAVTPQKPAEIFTAVANRLLDLAPTLSESQQAAVPAPTPDWTVVDTYRHLAGATTDVLEGRVEGMGTPEWTAAHIAARTGLSLGEVCAEWAAGAPELAARMAAGPFPFPRLPVGYWIHEQDIRVAVGVGALRDDPHLAVMANAFLGARAQPYEDSKALPLLVLGSDQPLEVMLGDGEPALTVRTSVFEVLRMVSSRRSLRQCLAAEWTGGDLAARTAAIQAMAAFPLPTSDVDD